MLKLFICSAALLLCSCAADINIRDDFGDAVKHNLAVQTINPLSTADDDSEFMDGQKAIQAIDRYRQAPASVESRTLVTE